MHRGEKVILTVKPQYGFGEDGQKANDRDIAVPPNETLTINLELVSWKTVEKVTDDYKVMKKILVDGEGYERPNEGATVEVQIVTRLQATGDVVDQFGEDEKCGSLHGLSI
eukprot:TRINITY_DN366_c0_g1_i10.p2 TRINITY_DN366_c0_g1~~TRINITY_DN366_c0_g1_i10.p2  ORF type:complete len:111 (+),score=17.52 TRINITY_DN366_c0_g1_i10:2736-3068(+)